MIEIIANETAILNPTLWVGSFEWREPVTTLTDLLTSIVCLFLFLRLNKNQGEKSESYSHYKNYFLLFSIGMFCAAWFGHGLQAYFGFDWKKIGWVLSSLAFLQIEKATLKDSKENISKSLFRFLNVFIIIQFVVMVSIMVSFQNFKIPQINSTITFVLLILPLQFFNFIKGQKQGSLAVVLTILYAAIPGFIYSNQISINRWFNYHDISHVLMSVFMLLLYRAVIKLSFVSEKAS